MVAGTALVMIAGARQDQAHEVAAPQPVRETPWLTPEAAAQIVGPGGSLGPLFEGVKLGGTPPSAEVRARIEEFARANRVDIAFEVVDEQLLAVHFAVTFGGCCGYEGADVLALRMRRPETSLCCGCQESWVDDWAIASDDGVHMRARVRVNRVEARWERTLSFAELLERAEGLLGRSATTGSEIVDRWIVGEGGRHVLETPYPFTTFTDFGQPVPLRDRNDLGIQVLIDSGRITEVALEFRDPDGSVTTAALRSRWGRPRVAHDTWTWRTANGTVTAELGDWPKRITIR
ncbi:MAG TPA: hypothetical protein VIV11_31785, partial [Kofleriaceae bacterium]